VTDKIIRFPGAKAPPKPVPSKEELGYDPALPGSEQTGIVLRDSYGKVVKLVEEQAKALNVVLSGHPFLLIGIKPVHNGADIYSSVFGDPEELRKIHPKLLELIDRAYDRSGIPHD
jgi:hypothetical protein